MTLQQNKGLLIDRRDAAMAQLAQLDASQGARRLPLKAEMQLLDALLTTADPATTRSSNGRLRAS